VTGNESGRPRLDWKSSSLARPDMVFPQAGKKEVSAVRDSE